MIQFLKNLFSFKKAPKEIEPPIKHFLGERRIVSEYSGNRVITSRGIQQYPISPTDAFSSPMYIAGFDDYSPSHDSSSHSDYSHGGGDFSGGGSSGSWGSDSCDSGSYSDSSCSSSD